MTIYEIKKNNTQVRDARRRMPVVRRHAGRLFR